MVKRGKGEGSEGLDLESVLKEVEGIFGNINNDWEEQDFGALTANLFALGEKIGEVSPALASVLSACIQQYASAVKPFSDQLMTMWIGTFGYILEKVAETSDCLSDQLDRLAEVKAKGYARKMKAITGAGFSRKEAMELILAETARSAQSGLGMLKNLPKGNINKRSPE